MTKTDVRNRLLDLVSKDLFQTCSSDLRIRLSIRDGEPIPDSCLPGRLIMKLTEEEREVLKTFTSDDWMGIIK
jgi:hypothetical protein